MPCNGKSLYLQHWTEKNIWSITDLIKDQSYLLSYENFSSKYNIAQLVFSLIEWVKWSLCQSEYWSKTSINCCVWLIYLSFNLMVMIFWLRKIQRNWSVMNWIVHCTHYSQIETPSFNCFLDQALKNGDLIHTLWVHLKNLNDIHPTSTLLRWRFNTDHNNCNFCGTEIETVDHLCFLCFLRGFAGLFVNQNPSTCSSHRRKCCLVLTWRTVRVTWFWKS